MNALGSLYYNDMHDYDQATEWFKKASEKGCTRSLNNLGSCYESGHGVEKNRDTAYQLYKESAEKGYD
jgi:TPR repeat protein